MTVLAIKDWKKHQHYNDPRPPWIKLYGALLDDAAFLALPDAAQLQLVKLWLLASRMGHPLPNDPRLLAGKIGCRGKFYLDVLIDSGFLAYKESRESLDESVAEFRPLSTEDREQRTETTGAGEKSSRPTSALPPYDQVFEEAWTAYPKRPNNNKAAAWRQWLARVAEGVEPLDMLEGARRYARLVVRDGTEPKFVKHGATFFGRDRHFENDLTPMLPKGALETRVADLVAEEDAAIARTAALLASRGAA